MPRDFRQYELFPEIEAIRKRCEPTIADSRMPSFEEFKAALGRAILEESVREIVEDAHAKK